MYARRLSPQMRRHPIPNQSLWVESSDFDSDDGFRDASNDFRSLTEAERKSRMAHDSDRDEFFSLSHVSLRLRREQSPPLTQPHHSRSKIKYDSTGPHDERYYVPFSNPAQDNSRRYREKDVTSQNSHPFNGIYDIPPFDSNQNGRVRGVSPRKSNPNLCENPAPPRSLRSLFSKSTTELIMEDPELKRLASSMQANKDPLPRFASVSKETPAPDYSPVVKRRFRSKSAERTPRKQLFKEKSVWSNAQRYKGSLDQQRPEGQEAPGPRETLKHAIKDRPPVRDFVSLITNQQKQRLNNAPRSFLNKSYLGTFKTLDSVEGSDCSKISSEEKDEETPNRLQMSEHTVRVYREILNIMNNQKSERSKTRVRSESSCPPNYFGRMRAYNNTDSSSILSTDNPDSPSPAEAKLGRLSIQFRNPSVENLEHVRDIPDTDTPLLSNDNFHLSKKEENGVSFHRQSLHFNPVMEDVQSKQSHFFNSLFPSRANRFGYPVYPERDFGIPSMSGPVSFAGFSPAPDPVMLNGMSSDSSNISHPSYFSEAADKKEAKPKKISKILNLKKYFS